MDHIARFLEQDASRRARRFRATERYKALVAAGLHVAIGELYPRLPLEKRRRLAEAHTELLRYKELGSAKGFAAVVEAYITALRQIFLEQTADA